jgi:predicted nucleic acid-binding protein
VSATPTVARPRRVFLDSSGYLALVNPNDAYHPQALAAWTLLTDERWHTFTTNFVVAEADALFLARLGHRHATAFLHQSAQRDTVVVRVSSRDELRAQQIVFQYDDKDFSLTDATSFAVMERLRIGTAFSYDHNFAQYGFHLAQ